MKQHVCTEASLERKASATLRAVEGLLSVGSMDSLVGFELQQLGEGSPAVFAAQRLLVLTLILLLRSAPRGVELYGTFTSGGVSWGAISWMFWLQLTETLLTKKKKRKFCICFKSSFLSFLIFGQMAIVGE